MDYSEVFAYYRDTCAPSIAKLENFYSRNFEYTQSSESADDTPDEQSRDKYPIRVISQYPEIHNEIRMAFTHLARTALSFDQSRYATLLSETGRSPTAYLDSIKKAEGVPFSKDREPNIQKAFDHLQRAAMDAEKCLYLARMKKSEEVLECYVDYSVEEVGNGGFFEKVNEYRVRAAGNFEKAKIAESLGDHSLAKKYYGEADKEASGLEDFLDEKTPALDKAKQDYVKSPWKILRWDLVFLGISAVVTVVAAILSNYASNLGGA